MLRSNLNRVPGRLAYNSVSLYSKEGTTIQSDLVYDTEAIGVAGYGKLDNRDKEAYAEITITPDGRMTTALAAVLWPYANSAIAAPLFTTGTNVPAVIHGNDSSLDTYANAAIIQMPQMIFHPLKTLVGPVKLICLRSDSTSSPYPINAWSVANSLRTYANSGGTFVDSTFTTAGIITQDYQLTWGSVSGWSSLDFYDGLTFEPKIEYVDDNIASLGLVNKRVKTIGGMLRGIPIGVTRQMIDTALNIQGTGAVRGASGAAKANSVSVVGADGKTYLAAPLGQLIKSKIENGVEQLREGEIAFEFLPALSSGVRGAYFTTPIA